MIENRLVNTREAATATGLSEMMLRRGWKAGIYPAIELGGGGRGVRLRWNLNLLEAAILSQMQTEQAARKDAAASGI